MPSSFTSRLKLERQASGENSGNWGNLVNYVFNRVDASVKGYQSVDVAGSANVTLTSNNSTSNTDDSTTDDQVHNAILEFTGALTGDIHVFTDAVETKYTVFNNTTGSQTLTFANTGHAANGVVLKQGAKTLVYSDGSSISDVMTNLGNITTNGNISIADGNSIVDAANQEQIKFAQTASAVNEITITNNSAGNAPSVTATGDDTNIDLELAGKGTGVVTSGSSAVKVAGKETIWVPAASMYPSNTGGCADLEGVELAADINRPFLKVLAFDSSSDEAAQFAVAFPKSWNEGTVTFQPYFTVNSTSTNNVLFKLKGIAISDDDAINQDFGTAQGTAKAHSGTAYDLDVGAESSAITIAGTPAAGDEVFFQIFRDVSGDDLAADALLLGVKLFFTTDAANDA